MTIKLAAAAILALAADFPTQVPLINELATAGKEEPEIRARLGEGRFTALAAEVATLKAAIETQKGEHAVALKAATDAKAKAETDHAALQVKFNALKGIKDGAPSDVGGTPAEKALEGLTGEVLWKAEFASSKELQERFAFGGEAGYLAFKRNEKPTK